MVERSENKSDILMRLKAPEGSVCLYCKTDSNDELLCGNIIEKNGIKIHYYCMLFSCGLAQQEDIEEGIIGFRFDDIQREYQRGRRLKCSYCKKAGGTIGCYNNLCRKSFHLPCGLKHNSLHQFFGIFKSYCEKHRPMQSVPQKEQSGKLTLCPICLDKVEAKVTFDNLRSNCCKTSWFHRHCIQKQALSAGYFFRCPLCNNCEEFKTEMRTYGIYIPEKDASWELEQNAYQELLFRYSKCDASLCLCPKGRNFKNSHWNVVLCNTCGSRGCHKKCGMLNDSITEWECNDCQSVRNLTLTSQPVSSSEKRKPESNRTSESDNKRTKLSSLCLQEADKMTRLNTMQFCPESGNAKSQNLIGKDQWLKRKNIRQDCSLVLSSGKISNKMEQNRQKRLQPISVRSSSSNNNNNNNSAIRRNLLDKKNNCTKVTQISSKSCCADCGNSKTCIKFLLATLQPVSVNNDNSSSCSLS